MKYTLTGLTAIFCFSQCVFAAERKIREVPYYANAKAGQIQVPQEGEIGTFARQGLLPVGESVGKLGAASNAQLKNWSAALCEKLQSLKAVTFPSGAWTKTPGKSCGVQDSVGFLIDQGSLKGFGVLEGLMISKEKGFKGGRVTALMKLDSKQDASEVMGVVAGVEVVKEDGGNPELEFVSAQEAVLKFHGYVSEWQLYWKVLPEKGTVEVVVLK
jgi:hypothetical protein